MKPPNNEPPADLLPEEAKVPDLISTIMRDRGDLPTPASNTLGEQIIRLNRQILRDGLANSGIAPTTIDKLKAFDGFASSAGDFLLAALDLSHRSMLYLMVHLLEEAERIKKKYLMNDLLDDETKLGWQEAYTDIVEQVGKCYDRTLTGTQAMARMLGTDKGEKQSKKPGFKALRRVQKT